MGHTDHEPIHTTREAIVVARALMQQSMEGRILRAFTLRIDLGHAGASIAAFEDLAEENGFSFVRGEDEHDFKRSPEYRYTRTMFLNQQPPRD